MRIIGKQGRFLWWLLWLAAACLTAAVSPLGAQDGTGCSFSDVPQSSPQQADIVYACQQGWFQGYPGGTFRPSREVPQNQITVVVSRAFPTGSTRADLATFLRGGNPGDPDGSANFDDVAESHPQSGDIAYAVEQGWFQGYPDSTFRPDRTITPTQIATVASRSFPAGSTRADLATFMRQGNQALNDLTPPTSKIAYTVPIYDSLGDQVALELWVSGADGSGARRLTGDISNDSGGLWYAIRTGIGLTDDLPDDSGGWGWSPDGERIAYQVDEELWVESADGSGARRLTGDLPDFFGGGGWGWSPDGERIGFMVPVRDSLGDEVAYGLWVEEADGSGSRRLTNDVGWSGFGWNWLWSPDGNRIAYNRILRDFRGNEVEQKWWVASTDGSSSRQLTDVVSLWGWGSLMGWSPDGERIAYRVDEELWVEEADGSGARQLINNIREDFWWSPGGRWIAYESISMDFGWELWVLGLDGSGARRLISSDNRCGGSPFSDLWWSDRQSIVLEVSLRKCPYSYGSVDAKELWIAEVDGSSLLRLTDDFAYNWGWSPDGDRIAYESRIYEFGKWLGTGLWVAEADGSGARQLAKDIQSWGWSPGGEGIAYEVKKRDSRRSVVGSELWIVGSDGLGAHRLIDDIANNIWGWLPNSERIVYGVNKRDSSGNKVGEELWVTEVDASPHQLTDDIAINDWISSLDGEWIAYGVDSSGSKMGVELWVASADGSATRKLADNVDNWRWQPMER